jgi:NADH-quinone oxidoreductase subunit E
MLETANVDYAPALKVLDEMGRPGRGDTIPLLQRLQDAYGYLPKDVVFEVSRRTGIPASQLYGVATFYAQFYMEPRGKHTIRCCRGTACHVKGGKKVATEIAKQLDVEEGRTTSDRKFTFETVACLGTCFLAPVVMIDESYHGSMTPDRVKRILKPYR